MKTDVVEYFIAEEFLPALINGDETGLTDDESKNLEALVYFAEKYAEQSGATHWHWSAGEEYGFTVDEVTGMYGNCYNVEQVLFFKD